MKKLKLELDELKVESFDTSANGGENRGTVQGNEYHCCCCCCYPCCCGGSYNTCAVSCNGTCDASCNGTCVTCAASCNGSCDASCGGTCYDYTCGGSCYDSCDYYNCQTYGGGGWQYERQYCNVY